MQAFGGDSGRKSLQDNVGTRFDSVNVQIALALKKFFSDRRSEGNNSQDHKMNRGR